MGASKGVIGNGASLFHLIVNRITLATPLKNLYGKWALPKA
jgi:hypothetical protein